MKQDTLPGSGLVEFSAETAKSDKPALTKTGVLILGISGVSFFGVYAVATPFLLPALRRICLPFVPATDTQVRNVFSALRGRSGTLIDIGSGDGRIVIEAAKRGFQASGVELNSWLLWYSQWTAYRHGLSSKTTFFRKDLWKTDMSPYNNVVIFGVEQMMEPLERKLDTELSPDGTVVACRFPFPTWQPSVVVGSGVDTVWLYKRSHTHL